MSGGTWDYKDAKLESYKVKDLQDIISILMKVFHEIDWAESGDTSRKDAEPVVYNLMLELGDHLFVEDSI